MIKVPKTALFQVARVAIQKEEMKKETQADWSDVEEVCGQSPHFAPHDWLIVEVELIGRQVI